MRNKATFKALDECLRALSPVPAAARAASCAQTPVETKRKQQFVLQLRLRQCRAALSRALLTDTPETCQG